MAATKAFMNWTGTTFVYGSTTISLTDVESVDVQIQGQEVTLREGADDFARLSLSKNKTVRLVVKAADVSKLSTVPINTPGTFTTILNDALNGEGSGALTIVATKAILLSSPISGPQNQFAMGTATFVCYATDGTTSPLSYSQAS